AYSGQGWALRQREKAILDRQAEAERARGELRKTAPGDIWDRVKELNKQRRSLEERKTFFTGKQKQFKFEAESLRTTGENSKSEDTTAECIAEAQDKEKAAGSLAP